MCVRLNVWFLTSLVCCLHSDPRHHLVDSPVSITDLVLNDSLTRRPNRHVSECVSAGAQVMSSLTAVERCCYCSAPFNESTHVSRQHLHSYARAFLPSVHFFAILPVALSAAARLHCERLCNAHNRLLFDLTAEELAGDSAMHNGARRQSGSVIRMLGNKSTGEEVQWREVHKR